jgi:hypothetical protein
MATILFSALGAAAGSAVGGTVLGLGAAVVGRAVGATIGRAIDQQLLGAGSEPVETGRIERFRLMGAAEGAPVPRVWGRMRVAGQVIWATRFEERVRVRGGGKGAPAEPKVRAFSYSVSLAVALCAGEIARVGRIWADGVEIDRDALNLRVHTGTEDQLPDPKIEAVEGAGNAPAYRGIAYVVIEDLDLTPYGNRVPQFSFEVLRRAAPAPGVAPGYAQLIRGVALIPGTGEYALATTPVHYREGPGRRRTANVHAPGTATDFARSLEMLGEELPACGSALLVVSWFAGDLRCGHARLRPRVEQTALDGQGMPWRVSGLTRASAGTVPQSDGRPVYGGTPADAAVVEAIRALRAAGKAVVFYPFILMEQMADNTLPNPWTGTPGQPPLPWRGRITTSLAPGLPGSPDGTAAAAAEVAAFFGQAAPSQFVVTGERVDYTGPEDWGLRRMILHYAHLCAAAGGVDGFCIGSELRGLTQIRGPGNSFPAVAALRALAADVRAILGPSTKIGYAADWSEYFGYHPQDGSGDVFFHLDPLWADANIDFVGIDNYMPLSDWRDGNDHADAAAGSIYNLDYLTANVAGGEGFDWHYPSEDERQSQRRAPIEDGAHGEPWVFRYKDIRSWWENRHHDRVGGVRLPVPTDWVPQSKPVWFTEYGCPAIDKGTNQPNVFLDPKSSESAAPRFSSGVRDDLIQLQYFRAVHAHWSDPANNPVSEVYGGPMVDLSRAHAWAWDTRPHPQFPGLAGLWSDAANYARGHWLNGRASAEPLEAVVAEICADAGVVDADVRGLFGLVRGYAEAGAGTARAALQPLLLAHGIDAAEAEGRLRFRLRGARPVAELAPGDLALAPEPTGSVEAERAASAEIAGRVRLAFIEADGDYALRTDEAVFPDEPTTGVATCELPLALTGAEARGIVERWLAEARIARDGLRFAVPPSRLALAAGDTVKIVREAGSSLYRIDRVEDAGVRLVEAVRVEPSVQRPSDGADDLPGVRPFAPPLPVDPLFLDLPLLRGDEVPHAPHLAVVADPWPGSVALYAATAGDAGYELNRLVQTPAIAGVTLTPLPAARPGLWDRGAPLRVEVVGGALASAGFAQVLAGANLAAVGDPETGVWELIQFAEAVLVGPGTYDLSLRLRGQQGTDGVMPEVWPAGSSFVLINGALVQVDLPLSARRLARHYRVGPAGRPLDDPSYEHRVLAFDGVGLRPYPVAHLRAAALAGGGLALSWVRRTRIGGDSWEAEEVPLGEAREAYRLRVREGQAVRRTVELTQPAFTYTAAMRAADGVAPGFVIEVAQVSDIFGPGPWRAVVIDA